MTKARISGCAVSLFALMISGTCRAGAESGDESQLQEVVVTATKSATATKLQDTPLTVSVFNNKELEALHLDSITGLTNEIPNVRLNNAGVSTYSNAFFIRGMGVFSSIPSSTPAVGVFVDGVYVGANAGAVPPGAFDLKDVEVLRGPQGLLFGRNTTAGAVLMQTNDPTSTFHADLSSAVESGLNFIETAVLSGPLTEDGSLQGKIAGYYDHDQGYFRNLADDNHHFGKSDSTILHGALAWYPDEGQQHLLKFEVANTHGDGPPGQNHYVYSQNSLDFANDNNGYLGLNRQNVTLQSTWDVGFGHGTVVNIAGWRRSAVGGGADVMGTPTLVFDGYASQLLNQYSDELRYAGTFGPLSATVGLFGYSDSLNYVEERSLIPAPHFPAVLHFIGGGNQDSDTYAAFSNIDYEIVETLKLTLGARYSVEHKKAEVELIAPGQPCSLSTRQCSDFNFHDQKSWGSFTPKIGPTWQPTEDTNLYSYWTRAFRSGGYNLRQTDPTSPPAAYGQESVDAFEIGLKQRFFDKRLTFGLAAFDDKYKHLQRDLAYSLPGGIGNVATTQNVGDATISGIEFETTAAITPELTLSANYGYLSNKWDRIDISLVSPNGLVSPSDYLLKLPQVPRNSGGAALHYTKELSSGKLRADLSYQHVDRSFADDNNLTTLNPVDNLDANLTYSLADDRTSLSLYGKDLLNKVVLGINTIDIVGHNPPATDSPLTKARIVGAQVRYKF